MARAIAQPGGEAGRRSSRLSVYARLAKVDFYYHWLPVVVAWALLPSGLAGASRTVVVMGLLLVAAFLLAASSCSLDDVQGTRDGLDQRTYRPSEQLRDIRRKPLLMGEISDRHAARFGHVTGALGLLAALLGVGVAPHHPAWLAVVVIFSALAAIQYAYGVKVSYLGGGELLLAYVTAVTLLVPYLVIAGDLPGRVLLVGVLLACWMAQITLFSNTADAVEDRLANRRTFATRLSGTANKRYILAIFIVGWSAAAVGIALGSFPWWLAPALVPCWLCELAQLREGLGQDRWFVARHLGRRAFDVGLLGLLAVVLAQEYL